MGDGQRRYRIGLDIGGTFTDFILNDAATGGGAPAQAADDTSRPVGRRARGARGTGGDGGIGVADVAEIDLGVVRYACDRVAFLDRGRLVEEGPTAKILDAPASHYARMLPATVPDPDPDKSFLRGSA